MGEWETEGFRVVIILGQERCSSMQSYCDSLRSKEADFRGAGRSTEHNSLSQSKKVVNFGRSWSS